MLSLQIALGIWLGGVFLIATIWGFGAVYDGLMRRSLYQRLARIRCWFRGYHVNSPNIGKFRYDVSGMCFDCGKVGSGIEPDQD